MNKFTQGETCDDVDWRYLVFRIKEMECRVEVSEGKKPNMGQED